MPAKQTSCTLKPSTKPPLILVHGYRGAPQGLAQVADYLKQAGYEVHCPAIPPFAGAKPLTTYSSNSYADFLAHYIREHRLNRPVLIGHSMGSIIVAATANMYAELVSSRLILLSPISARTPRFASFFAPLTGLASPKLIDYITTHYLFVKESGANLSQVLSVTNSCSNDHTPSRSELKKATFFSTHYTVSDFSLLQKVLIIAGKKDRLIKKSATIKLAQNLDAKLVLLPRTGHLHNYEKPQETADAIIDFLNHSA